MTREDSLSETFDRAIEAMHPSRPLVVGVSGGIDSMALLELLSRRTRSLVVAHFNHQLRGEESDGDEAFVRDEAKRRSLPFQAGRGDVRGAAKGISIEMAARNLRHEFLANVARQFSADIALAHHANDQVELYLMRKERGVKGPGLAGMTAVAKSPSDPAVRILRPLLEITRPQIEAFARDANLQFREDSSNRRLDADRNYVRHVVIPQLREKHGAGLERIVLKRVAALRAKTDFAREAARAWIGSSQGFSTLSHSQKLNILALQLEDLQINVTGALLEHLAAGRIATIDANRRAKAVNGRLRILEQAGNDLLEVNLSVPGQIGFCGLEISWDLPAAADLKPDLHTLVFDADRIGARAVLRHGREGDRVQLLGRGSERPLLDVMARNKIPLDDRGSLVVAENAAGKIFWVERLRMTEQFKVTESARRFLQWRWTRK